MPGLAADRQFSGGVGVQSVGRGYRTKETSLLIFPSWRAEFCARERKRLKEYR